MSGYPNGRPAADVRHVETDVAVVGGGPAGLTAALVLARGGLRVTLIDESGTLGGQYYKRRAEPLAAAFGDFRPQGTALIREVRAAGVNCLTDTVVWGADDDGRTLFTADARTGTAGQVHARATVVATGAFERTAPFPGWVLPGVVTPGFALHLATMDRVPVGSRVVVAGTGPFLLPVACALLEVGARVEALLELNHPYRPGFAALGALRHPARLKEAAGYLMTLARHGVRVEQGRRVLAAYGDEDRVRTVEIGPADPAAGGATRRVDVDALCVGFGFRPSTELPRLLGCRTRLDVTTGEELPEVDPDGATSVDGLYLAGEVAGIAGVHAARVRGELAARAILRRLAGAPGGGRVPASDDGRAPGRDDGHGLAPGGAGSPAADGGRGPVPGGGPSSAAGGGAPAPGGGSYPTADDGRRLAALRRRARALDRFAELNQRLFPVPADLATSLDHSTIVCRCEGITAGEVRRAAGTGWNDLHGVKGATRAGMGPCQGRECGHIVAALAGEAGCTCAPAVFAARFPLKPVPVPTAMAATRPAEPDATKGQAV